MPLTSAACHPGLSPGRSTTAGGWGGGEEEREEEEEEKRRRGRRRSERRRRRGRRGRRRRRRGKEKSQHLTMQSRLACLAKILIGPFRVSFATNKSSTLVIILVK